MLLHNQTQHITSQQENAHCKKPQGREVAISNHWGATIFTKLATSFWLQNQDRFGQHFVLSQSTTSRIPCQFCHHLCSTSKDFITTSTVCSARPCALQIYLIWFISPVSLSSFMSTYVCVSSWYIDV